MLVWQLEEYGITLEIVTRSRDQQGFVVQPQRWVIERTIAWLNRNRRLAKDYERLTSSSEAVIYIASIHRMLQCLHPKPGRPTAYADTTTESREPTFSLLSQFSSS